MISGATQPLNLSAPRQRAVETADFTALSVVSTCRRRNLTDYRATQRKSADAVFLQDSDPGGFQHGRWALPTSVFTPARLLVRQQAARVCRYRQGLK